MKIATTYNPKPIPDRRYDWEAIDSDTYEGGCPIGHGRTEGEAVADLMDQLGEEDEELEQCEDCGRVIPTDSLIEMCGMMRCNRCTRRVARELGIEDEDEAYDRSRCA